MAFKHSLSYQYSTGGNSVNTVATASSELELNLDVVVPAESTNYSIAYNLDVSQCKAVFITADRDLLMKTNHATNPSQSFSITASVPIAWMTGAGTCPLTHDTVALYVTDTDLSGSNLTVRTLVDATV